jgi:hypothetical protein
VEVEAEGQEEAYGERDPEYVNRSERMSTSLVPSRSHSMRPTCCEHIQRGRYPMLF